MQDHQKQHRRILRTIARRVMLERGFLPDFSKSVQKEIARMQEPVPSRVPAPRDLRNLPWCSIDNDDSMDLDQLTVAQALPDGRTRILVAIADVDALVRCGSAVDEHARTNTTSIYTAAEIFPMLPEQLSTDLTSLADQAERQSMVVDMQVEAGGAVFDADLYPALVLNRAKLAYNSVSEWLNGQIPPPSALAAVKGLEENLRLQDRVAQAMKRFRHMHGALSLQTLETRPIFTGERVERLEVETHNRARDIIEDFMIAANTATVRKLEECHFPSIHRVVRTPRRWDRIVELAAEHGGRLPEEPDSRALEEFLVQEKEDDPLRFPDLSLSVIKLMGSGEYVAEEPGHKVPGHFGLAVMDYTHSTAPNRRYTDLITQRLLKAALSGKAPPYGFDELTALALHCTRAEDEAAKVERQVGKSAAALMLEGQTGSEYEGFVTGASPKGTWVRLIEPPVEGKVVQGEKGLDVGQRVKVRLVEVNVDRGFIDFARIH